MAMRDEAVPVERSGDMIAAIERAGGQPKYTELAGVGHDSWTPAYTDRRCAAVVVRGGERRTRPVMPAASETGGAFKTSGALCGT